jgi:hypothetical protein
VIALCKKQYLHLAFYPIAACDGGRLDDFLFPIYRFTINGDDTFKETTNNFDINDFILPVVLTDAKEDGVLFGIIFWKMLFLRIAYRTGLMQTRNMLSAFVIHLRNKKPPGC